MSPNRRGKTLSPPEPRSHAPRDAEQAPIAPAAAPAPRGRGRPRGSSDRHDDKLTQILTTAAELFAEHGYESTTLDAIAQQLDMHKATLYHYVSGKGEILYLCQSRSFGNLDEVYVQVRDRSQPVVDRLRLFVRHLAHAQNSVFGRCLLRVGPKPLAEAAGGEIRRIQRRLDGIVRELLIEGVASGELRPLDPALCVAMLFGALNWVPRWYRPEGRHSVDDIAQAYMDILIDGVRAPPGTPLRRGQQTPLAKSPASLASTPRPAPAAPRPRRR